MNQRTFIYQLQIIDHELDKNEKRLSEIKNTLADNKDIQKIEQEISTLDLDLKNQNQKFNKISDQARSIQDKKSKSEQSLYDGSIKHPKELQNVNSEIDSLKKRISVLDEQLLELMYLIEDLEEKIKIKKDFYQSLINKKHAEKEVLQIEIDEIEKENKKLNIEKIPIQNHIDNDFLLMYEKLRKSKNKIAISLIIDNACSICGNSLAPMEIQKAKSSTDDVFCPVCKRFLYIG